MLFIGFAFLAFAEVLKFEPGKSRERSKRQQWLNCGFELFTPNHVIQTTNEEPAEPFSTYCETIGAITEIEENKEELIEELNNAYESAGDKEGHIYRIGLAEEALDFMDQVTDRLRATLALGTLPPAKCGKCCACFAESEE